MIKYLSFTKTLLLVIASGVVIDDWNAINRDILPWNKILNFISKEINVVFVL